MKLKISYFILFFTLFIHSGYSQTLRDQKTKMYYYTFSGTLNSDNIEMLTNEISKMQFVTEAKIEYKAEKSLGQVRLLATEYYTNKDTDYELNIYNLKMLLIQYNLMPNEYRFEILSK